MGEALTSVFFYGLFMDEALLRAQGLAPESACMAELRDHDIRIGKRAFIVAAPDMSVWGMVFDLPESQVERLYASPGVADYRPAPVRAMTPGGEAIAAQCYNLPESDAPREDDVYLDKLIALCRRLELPQAYLDRLARL